MRNRHSLLILVLIAGLAAFSLACPKKAPVETPPEPAETEATPTPPPAVETEAPAEEIRETFPSEPVDTAPAPEPTVDELNAQGVLKTVYFEFDSDELDEVARATLQENARWMRENPTRSIRIEGHCDERGTIEYNLALGERRASAVRDYMVSLGLDASRIRIVSFGEERPVDPGHDETAWAKNRRGDFVIES